MARAREESTVWGVSGDVVGKISTDSDYPARSRKMNVIFSSLEYEDVGSKI